MSNNVSRIYANKIDYITYLMANPELVKQIGNKLLLPSTAIMNFMLYKQCYGVSEEAKKKNIVYQNTIYKFLEHLPQESVRDSLKKLISTNQIIRSDRDFFYVSNKITQYFYGLTEIETFNTLNTSDTPKKVKTDNSWSNLPSLKCFRNEDIRNALKEQKLDDDQFKSPEGQLKVMRVLIFGLMSMVTKANAEKSFIDDINCLFKHFGADPDYIKKMYDETKTRYLNIQP